ncbi:MAG TPA: methyltransferase domain-containing protein [Candidatus Vogelbacteria bacterium]|nr:methyltransferase domain-containing protein [Candidatus Vogelbacteria bacterium]
MNISEIKKHLEKLNLVPGERVADFGAGSGIYTIEAARQIGHKGKVYAIEIQKELLEKIKQLASQESLDNIEYFWGDLEENGGSKLGDSSVDAVILANIIFQVEKKDILLQEAYRVLKPLGRLLIIDWSGSYSNLGPPEEYVVKEEEANQLAAQAGLHQEDNFRAGDYHYGLIFTKQAS